MNEKIKRAFTKENFKRISKRVFTKKKIIAAASVVVVLAGLKIGYQLMFKVEGTVLKVGQNSIVVTNFLGTKTVNTGDYPIDSNKIVVGEKIEITKNLSGDVTSIRLEDGRRGGDRKGFGMQQGRDGRFSQDQGQLQGPNGGGQRGRQGAPGMKNGQNTPDMKNGQGSPDGTSSPSLQNPTNDQKPGVTQ